MTSGAERAHIFRDRLRSVELRLTQLQADQLAGAEVSDDEIAKLEEQIVALNDAADQAESEDRS